MKKTKQKIDPNRTHKVCTVCKKDKEREAYYANKTNRDGLSSMCKECQGLFSAIRLYAQMSKEKQAEEIENAYKKIGRLKKLLDGKAVVDIVRSECV